VLNIAMKTKDRCSEINNVIFQYGYVQNTSLFGL